MRGLPLWFALLASCGRLNFGPAADGGRTDAKIFLDDGGTPIEGVVCEAVPIALTLDSPATDVIAAQPPTGFALGFLLGESFLAGIALDSSLQPNASTPHQTSGGGVNLYSRASVVWDGTTLVGSVSRVDGNCYLKAFQNDMVNFTIAEYRGSCITPEPSVALAAGRRISTWFVDGNLMYAELDSTGMPTGEDVDRGAAGGMILDGSVASGQVVVAAMQTSGGGCTLMAIPGAATNSVGACQRPRIINAGNDVDFALAYESAGETALRWVSYSAALDTLAFGPLVALGTGTNPILLARAGAPLVVVRDGTSLAIRTTKPTAPATILGLPTTPVDAFEVAGPYVFATFGTSVYAITCN